ncbi:MAG: T9SS type A sorting domain-containing protein [Cyclobacteriaceae bacterium]|nr:T9SS type A sorting domain-containing protein [Cyclobacteriaceae bacterium HetDA_MAG_MS6]
MKSFSIDYCILGILLLSTYTTWSNNLQDSSDVAEVYLAFEETVADKQTTEHLNLYLSSSTRVNISLKSNGNPTNNLIDAATWTTFFNSPGVYQLDISNTVIEVYGNIAFSEARFDLLRDSGYTGFGIDLFVYVKTPEGWKFALLNNTYQDITDSTDYTLNQIDSDPTEVLDNMVAQYNNDNKGSFINSFVDNSMPCYMFQGTFNDEVGSSTHTASAFADSLLGRSYETTMLLENTTYEIVDDYMAKSISDIKIVQEDSTYIDGKAFATYIGTRSFGWRISGLIISVDRKNFDLEPLVETSIADKVYNKIFAYPNPSKGMFTVDLRQRYSSVYLKVTDLQGREIIQNTIHNKRNIQLELPPKPGVYFVEFITDNRSKSVIRLVKE